MDPEPDKKIVTVQLMGGLGNQLFQIFAAIAYSLRHSAECVLPFQVLGGRPHYWDSLLKRLVQPFVRVSPPLTKGYTVALREPHFHYAAIPVPPEDAAVTALVGYFQSPRYFADYRAEIMEAIGFREQQARVLAKYGDLLPSTVAMHFRRGDYVKYPQQHPILPVTYYRSALLGLPLEGKARVLYFCEEADRAHVERHYVGLLQAEFPHLEFSGVDGAIADWEQLLIMTLCRDFVIANSSFSWWGAYLSDGRGSVMCPDAWFGPALRMNSTRDLFPSGWTRVLDRAYPA